MRIKKVKEIPGGYRQLGTRLASSKVAVKFTYYDWELWIPVKAIRQHGETFYCPLWAIESAKEFVEARRTGAARR